MLTVNSYSYGVFALICTTRFTLFHTRTPFEKKASLQKELSSNNLDKPSYKLKAFHAKPKVLLHMSIRARIYIIRICFKKRLCMHLHIHFLCTCNILLTIPQFYGKWFTIDSGPVLHQVASRRASDAGDVADITARFLGCPKHVHRKMATAIGKDMRDKSHLKFICLVVFTVITWSLFFLHIQINYSCFGT